MNEFSSEHSVTTDPRNLFYISDLDGTLLNHEGQLPKDSINRLNRLITQGLNFTIATARNYDSAYPILSGLNLRYPVILFNGVYLTELHTGKNVFFSDFISKDVIGHMMDIVKPRGIHPFIYTYGNKHRVYYRSATNPGALDYINSLNGEGRLQKVTEYVFTESERISGFLLIDTREVLEPIYNKLQARYVDELNIYFARDVSNPRFYWLQSFHREASKGRMLKRMAENLDVPLSKVVVFGDYLNDLDMFKVAGRAIAVANALPEVQSAAHEIIGSNIEQGVVAYLESLWKPK